MSAATLGVASAGGEEAIKQAAPGPLSGLRVIDWTIWQQGPVAGVMLGDLGAEVIKIEERVRGDGGRAMFRFEETGSSPYWEITNRNKRSVAIDLKKPGGIALVRDLIANADIFIHNFRPSIPERLGLGYEDLRKANPKLIYASASAFGPEGEEGRARAYDLLGQARAGLLLRTGDEVEPGLPDSGLADQMGAIMLAYGVLTAVVARERYGVGQRVDTSMLGSMLWLRALPLALALMTVDGKSAVSPVRKHMKNAKTPSRQDPGNPLWNTYKCADGRWIAMAMLQSDAYYPDFLEAMGHPPEIADDPRFVDHLSRCENSQECVALLDAIFATRPRDEWMQRLIASGDLPVAPLNTTAEAAVDPQAIINGYITTLHHPAFGDLSVPGFPIGLSETPARISRQAPEFGEHTEEVLMEILDLDWDRLGELRAENVI